MCTYNAINVCMVIFYYTVNDLYTCIYYLRVVQQLSDDGLIVKQIDSLAFFRNILKI